MDINSMLTVVATGGTTTTDFDTITGAFSSISELVSSVISAIVGNPILVIFMACGFLGIGLRMFRSLKSTAKAN